VWVRGTTILRRVALRPLSAASGVLPRLIGAGGCRSRGDTGTAVHSLACTPLAQRRLTMRVWVRGTTILRRGRHSGHCPPRQGVCHVSSAPEAPEATQALLFTAWPAATHGTCVGSVRGSAVSRAACAATTTTPFRMAAQDGRLWRVQGAALWLSHLQGAPPSLQWDVTAKSRKRQAKRNRRRMLRG